VLDVAGRGSSLECLLVCEVATLSASTSVP
jgi:hypothetical protein